MVALSASGEIFSLQGEGGVGLDGWIRASGGGRLRGDVLAELTLCHGISAGIGAQVAAEAEARLGALWVLAAGGDADASAQAQAFAKGIFSGNVFEEFGVALRAGAEASASASAQAHAGLDAAGVAALAQATLDGLALDLFVAFLNEVRIEGGARASAYAGAAALAEVAVAGNLLEDPARFEITAGAGAAAGVGAGAEAFFHCELDDAERFAANSAELVAAAIAAAARRELPESAHGLVEYLELLVPVAFRAAWQLGRISSLDALAPPDAFARRLTDVVGAQLVRWVLDQAVDLGFTLLAAALRDLGALADLDALDPAARRALADRLDAIADGLPTDPVALDRLATTAADVLDAVGPVFGTGVTRGLREPLAIAWTAAAAAIAVRDPVAAGGGSASVVGGGTVSGGGPVLDVPDPPAFVRAAWTAAGVTAGRTEADFADCVDYLLAVGVPGDLATVPHLGPLLRDLATRLDLTAGDLVAAALTAGVGGGLSQTELYRRLRDLLGEGIDGAIATQLVPRLRAALPADDGARVWLDEAALPSLLALRSFALDRLDALVDGAVGGDLSPFLNRFRTLLGVLAGKIALRNVEVLAEVLTDHVLEALPGELRAMATLVADGGADATAQDFRELVAGLAPFADADLLDRAARRFLAGLLDVAAEGFAVYTPARRRQLAALQRRAWRVDDLAVDYGRVADVGDLVDELLDCSSVPDGDAVLELAALQLRLLADQFGRTVLPSAALLAEFLATVTTPLVAEVEEGLRETLRLLQEGLETVRRLLEDAQAALDEALDDVDACAEALRTQLRAAEDALGSDATRDAVREEIRRAGRAKALADGGAAGAALFDAAWLAFGGLVDPALDALGAVAGWLDDVVEDATDALHVVADVERELMQRAQDALAGIDLAELAAFLGLDDILAAVASAPRQVARQLEAAARAAGDLARAEDRRDRARSDRDAARARRRGLRAQRDGINTRPVTARILNPSPLRGDPVKAVAHAGLVQLRIALSGADERLLAPGAPRRVEVLLNGARVRLLPGDLRGHELRRALSAADGLRGGLNVVECVVVQPRRPAARQAVAFAWHPRTGIDPGVRIDLSRSVIDTPGDDHRALGKERVVLVNEGAAPVTLTGWRVADRAGHVFRFDKVVLAPGGRVELVTGSGRDTRSRRHWGRRRAVWNNPGESVYLVGPDGLVRDVAVTGPDGRPSR